LAGQEKEWSRSGCNILPVLKILRLGTEGEKERLEPKRERKVDVNSTKAKIYKYELNLKNQFLLCFDLDLAFVKRRDVEEVS
jgi:hypothetical protein